MTVIQAYTSVAGFEKHGEWMAPKIPRLVPLFASPPDLRSCSGRYRAAGSFGALYDLRKSGHRSVTAGTTPWRP